MFCVFGCKVYLSSLFCLGDIIGFGVVILLILDLCWWICVWVICWVNVEKEYKCYGLFSVCLNCWYVSDIVGLGGNVKFWLFIDDI